MRIGVFDSGIGGLTVLKEMIKKYPHNQYYYFGDNKNIPYGTKTKEELSKLANSIIAFLESKNVDIIVIACGTVSSNVYEEVRQKYNTPIYDIISPTIEYINQSNYQKVGLMATSMTVRSGVFQKRIKKELTIQDCPKLVPLIEANQYTEELQQALKEYILKLKDSDCIILGCTHYPILEDMIKLICKADLINMGTVLCDRLTIESKGDLSVRLYFSKVDHALIENINRILNCDYQLEEV